MSPPAATCAVSSVTFLISEQPLEHGDQERDGNRDVHHAFRQVRVVGRVGEAQHHHGGGRDRGDHRGDAGHDDRGDDDAVKPPGPQQPDQQQRHQREPAEPLTAVDHVVEQVRQRLIRDQGGPPRRRGAVPLRRRRHGDQRAAGQHPHGEREEVPPVELGQRGIRVAQQRPGAEEAVHAAEYEGVRRPGAVPGIDEVHRAEQAGEYERPRRDPLARLLAEHQAGEDEQQGDRQVDRGERGGRPPQRPLDECAEPRDRGEDPRHGEPRAASTPNRRAGRALGPFPAICHTDPPGPVPRQRQRRNDGAHSDPFAQRPPAGAGRQALPTGPLSMRTGRRRYRCSAIADGGTTRLTFPTVGGEPCGAVPPHRVTIQVRLNTNNPDLP